MALQYVGGKTGTSSISLTALTGGIASAAQAGDIVVAVYSVASSVDEVLSISTGYTQVAELYSDGSGHDSNLRVAYKVLTAADTSVTFGPTQTVDSGAAAVHVWRGVNSSTPLDVVSTTATGIQNGQPDGDSITAQKNGAVILVAGGAASQNGNLFTSSDLSNFITAVNVADIRSEPTVGLGSYSWTSGLFNPTKWGGGGSGLAGSWTAVTLALRPAGGASKSLTPSLLTNSQTFYGPAVAPGPVNLTSTLIDSTTGIYAPFVVPPAVTLAPNRLDNGQAFYGAAVGAGPVVLAPPLVSNAQAFYPSTVASSALALRPPRLDNGPALYAPSVSTGGVSLQPGLLAGVQNFFASAVTPGGRALLPGQIVNAQAFFAPVVLAGSGSILPPWHVNSQQFPTALVTPGAVALSPSLLAQMQQFYAPTVRARLDIRFGLVVAQAHVDEAQLSAYAEQVQVQVTVDAVMARVETMQ